MSGISEHIDWTKHEWVEHELNVLIEHHRYHERDQLAIAAMFEEDDDAKDLDFSAKCREFAARRAARAEELVGVLAQVKAMKPMELPEDPVVP